MPYRPDRETRSCTVCSGPANLLRYDGTVGVVVECAACGDFQLDRTTAEDFHLPFADSKRRALASYTIRKAQQPKQLHRPLLTMEFFDALRSRSLPTPIEASDNMINWLAARADGRPGAAIPITHTDPSLLSTLGVIDAEDIDWILETLESHRMFRGSLGSDRSTGYLTRDGWERYEELKRAHVASSFAFFARRFQNSDLDKAFEKCFTPAVQQTGYELRMAPQKAGLIDAIIEDENRASY